MPVACCESCGLLYNQLGVKNRKKKNISDLWDSDALL